jgi:DNA-binding NarL/FixJ family response regulator
MGYRGSTLLDILSFQQFQAVILFALGLNTCQIADLLETSEWTVNSCLSDSFDRAECRSAEGLAVRLLFEYENNLYDERFEDAMAQLQSAAKRMLVNIACSAKTSSSVESGEDPSARWVM